MDSGLHTEFLYDLYADLEAPLEIGGAYRGQRRIFGVTGGAFEGPRLRGTVLPGGGDWFLLRPDGVGELDVRATARTEDGALIYVHYPGILAASPEIWGRIGRGERVPPADYYFRTTPVFETGSPEYAWLNSIVSVGVGAVEGLRVSYRVYQVC